MASVYKYRTTCLKSESTCPVCFECKKFMIILQKIIIPIIFFAKILWNLSLNNALWFLAKERIFSPKTSSRGHFVTYSLQSHFSLLLLLEVIYHLIIFHHPFFSSYFLIQLLHISDCTSIPIAPNTRGNLFSLTRSLLLLIVGNIWTRTMAAATPVHRSNMKQTRSPVRKGKSERPGPLVPLGCLCDCWSIIIRWEICKMLMAWWENADV